MNKQTSSQKIIVVFPAVDAYLSDATVEKAKKVGARVIQQDHRMFPAKGISMKKGLHEAISINADSISRCGYKESNSRVDR